MCSIATIEGFNNPNKDVIIFKEYSNYYIIDRNKHVIKIENVMHANYEEGENDDESYVYFVTDSGKLIPYINKYFLKSKKFVKI